MQDMKKKIKQFFGCYRIKKRELASETVIHKKGRLPKDYVVSENVNKEYFLCMLTKITNRGIIYI